MVGIAWCYSPIKQIDACRLSLMRSSCVSPETHYIKPSWAVVHWILLPQSGFAT